MEKIFWGTAKVFRAQKPNKPDYLEEPIDPSKRFLFRKDEATNEGSVNSKLEADKFIQSELKKYNQLKKASRESLEKFSDSINVKKPLDLIPFARLDRPLELVVALGIKETGVKSISSVCEGYCSKILSSLKSRPSLMYLHISLDVKKGYDWNWDLCQDFDKTEEWTEQTLRISKDNLPKKLLSVKLNLPCISMTCAMAWKAFMELQTQIVIFYSNIGPILWKFYDSIIKKNSENLSKVVLRRLLSYSIKNERHIPLDWNIFKDCVNLHYLKVSYYPQKKFLWRHHLIPVDEDFLSHKNIHLLPMNLETLYLIDIQLNFNDTDLLYKRKLLKPSFKFIIDHDSEEKLLEDDLQDLVDRQEQIEEMKNDTLRFNLKNIFITHVQQPEKQFEIQQAKEIVPIARNFLIIFINLGLVALISIFLFT